MTRAVPAQPIDSAAVNAAASIAEEALACHREALGLLAEGWQSETGSAITDFMDRQCMHAADVVDALRRVSGQVEVLPDSWTDPGSDPLLGRIADPADVAVPPDPDVAGPGLDPGEPIAPPTPVIPQSTPSPVSPWTEQVPASAWTAPMAGDAQWAGGPAPGGLPSAPALPDLGGVLVGLVAEIAQALGSYADTAPVNAAADAMDLNTAAAGKPEPPRVTRDEPPSTTIAGAAPPEGVPAAPGSAPPGPPTVGPVGATSSPATAPPAEPLPASPPTAELLAAERPPDPPTAPPAQIAPELPTVPPLRPPPPAADTAPEKTPCEIAADELPNVGE